MAKPKEPKKDTSPKVYQREKIKVDLNIRELPWTEKQKAMIELGMHKDTRILFVRGPAGTSKTTTAMRIGLGVLNERKVSDIVCIRAAVESSDAKLGYLPGDIDEKYGPYMGPFEDKLEELLPAAQGKLLKTENRIIYQPINFVRGSSWTARFIIMDECFPGSTRVLLADGKAATLRRLYELHKQGKQLPEVVSFNEQTSQFEPKQVLSVASKGKRHTLTIIAGNRKIRCTEEHPFLTPTGWREAAQLLPGDVLYTNGGTHQTVNALSTDQEQLVLGSLLGDGSVTTHGINRYRLKVLHGMDQLPYCSWKASIMGATVVPIEKNGFAQKPAVRFCTKVFALTSTTEQFTQGKKTCPDWVLNKLDARGLAVWYMDDGAYNDAGYCTLHTESFDYETQLKLVEFLQTKYAVTATIQEVSGVDYRYWYLRINKGKGNCDRFLELLAPYMHPSLLRKNPKAADAQAYTWDTEIPAYKFCVVDGIEHTNALEEVFDMEVEDNHNFLVTTSTRGAQAAQQSLSGVVAHNCQNMTINELQTLMTRIGKFTKMVICADSKQSDLPPNKRGAFDRLSKVFDTDKARAMGIYSLEFTKEDIVRSELCKFIVETFEDNERILHPEPSYGPPPKGYNPTMMPLVVPPAVIDPVALVQVPGKLPGGEVFTPGR